MPATQKILDLNAFDMREVVGLDRDVAKLVACAASAYSAPPRCSFTSVR